MVETKDVTGEREKLRTGWVTYIAHQNRECSEHSATRTSVGAMLFAGTQPYARVSHSGQEDVRLDIDKTSDDVLPAGRIATCHSTITTGMG